MKKILIALMMASLCTFGVACGGDDDGGAGNNSSGTSSDAGTSADSSDAGTSGGSSSEGDASTDSDGETCVAESDEDLCGSNECGSYSAYDNCGDYRTVDCGTCVDGYSCSSNVCVADESGDSGDTGDAESCTETLNDYDGISDTGESYYYNYGDYSSDYEGLWELEYYSDTTDTYIWIDMNNGEDASVALETMSFSTPGYIYYNEYLYCLDLASDGAEAAACAGINIGEDFFEMVSGTINITSVTNTFAGSISNGIFFSWNSYAYDETSGAETYCVAPAVSFSFSGAITE